MDTGGETVCIAYSHIYWVKGSVSGCMKDWVI